MKTPFPLLHFLLALFLFSFSLSAAAHANGNDFLGCLSERFQNSTSASQVIYTPDSTLYLSILNFSAQNLRFTTPATPRPLVIITPKQESHVQSAIYCARKYGIQIKVRSGGHDFEGLSYVSPIPFAIVDMINLRSVCVNLQEETAWIQTGARLGEVYYNIANKSKTLAFPAGTCPTVVLEGHISGGGLGQLVRTFGLAVDHVIDAQIVNANGQILDRKSMGEDLFWAIRGGGGASFGVILAWKLKLVTVPKIMTVFTVARILEQNATNLVCKWQTIADNIDNNLNMRVFLRSINSGQNGERTIQANFTALYLGRVDSLMPLMQKNFPELGLAKEDCQEMSWIDSCLYFYSGGSSLSDLLNVTFAFKFNTKLKADFVKKPIPQQVFEGIWKFFSQEDVDVPRWYSLLWGRMSEVPASQLPFPHRAGNKYLIEYQVNWLEGGEEAAKRHINWIRSLFNYLTPYVSTNPREAYINYRDIDIGVNNVEGNTSYAVARIWGIKYFLSNFNRLVFVKTLVDSTNFFKTEQSIPLRLMYENNHSKHLLFAYS